MVAAADEVGRLGCEFAQASLKGARTRFEHLGCWPVFAVEHFHHIVIEAGGGPGAGALELQGLIAGDGAGPRGEVRAEGVSLRLAAHGQERFLHDILGVTEVRFDRQDVI